MVQKVESLEPTIRVFHNPFVTWRGAWRRPPVPQRSLCRLGSWRSCDVRLTHSFEGGVLAQPQGAVVALWMWKPLSNLPVGGVIQLVLFWKKRDRCEFGSDLVFPPLGSVCSKDAGRPGLDLNDLEFKFLSSP